MIKYPAQRTLDKWIGRRNAAAAKISSEDSIYHFYRGASQYSCNMQFPSVRLRRDITRSKNGRIPLSKSSRKEMLHPSALGERSRSV